MSPPAPPIDPSALVGYYQSFLTPRAGEPRRILLTGHSHQAWPDVAREGLIECFDDAALAIDEKWPRVFAVQDRLRAGIAARIGGRPEDYAFASSTHELVARFLSAVDLARRPHLVTTTGEFHSIDRQLRRLAEAGVGVTWVAATPVATLAARLAEAVRGDTAAVLTSNVLFETGAVVPGLGELAAALRRREVALLVDAYHAFNVVPFAVDDYGPDAFVVAGGYKYAQWGEGVCFLRVPAATSLRPIYTGWFAGFAELAAARGGRAGGEAEATPPVSYPSDGAGRFAGSTFDPASFYRARAVLELFDELELDVARLRALSLRQTARIAAAAARLRLPVATPMDPAQRGGFVALRLADPAAVVHRLRALGIHSDSRGPLLRLGPAVYVTDPELDLLGDALRRAT